MEIGSFPIPMTDEYDGEAKLLRSLGWPEALIKSTWDEYSYSLGLASGVCICYESAHPSDDHRWVHLTGAEMVEAGRAVSYGRGIDVRVDQIIWVADGG